MTTTYWLSDGETADAPHDVQEAHQTIVSGWPFLALIRGYPRWINPAHVVSWSTDD